MAAKRSPRKSANPKLRWLEGARRAEELLAKERLPRQRAPEQLLGEDYDFPLDPATLTSMELGRLMLRLASLKGYSGDRLAREEIALHELDQVLEYLVPLKMLDLIRSDEFKDLPRAALVKEVLRSAAIDGDDLLKRLFHRSVDQRAAVARLKAQYEIYESGYYALSREQSRREASARAGIPG